MNEELAAMRRELHQLPEIDMELPRTVGYVTDRLTEMGIPYTLPDGGAGIIAKINGGKAGKAIAFRADMDALPVTEETGLPFASKIPGCMHACGHDAHMAMLLGAAKVLNAHKDELRGEVRLIFQAGEETANGAPLIVESGAVQGADAVFGTHIGTLNGPEIPTGTFIICQGPVMAAQGHFVITVKGTGCHGSTPEKGVDPVNIAAHIVLGLQAINARELGAHVPAVVTVGRIEGGAFYNVIPDEVVIEGTTRCFSDDVKAMINRRIEEIARLTAETFGGTADVYISRGVPTLVNDAAMAALAAEAAAEIVGQGRVITARPNPIMASDDFAYFVKEVPGAYMFLSSSDPEKGTDVAHHNPKFDVDEEVLWMGAAAFVNIAEKFL